MRLPCHKVIPIRKLNCRKGQQWKWKTDLNRYNCSSSHSAPRSFQTKSILAREENRMTALPWEYPRYDRNVIVLSNEFQILSKVKANSPPRELGHLTKTTERNNSFDHAQRELQQLSTQEDAPKWDNMRQWKFRQFISRKYPATYTGKYKYKNDTTLHH